jgi:hypothetical protein
VIVERIKHVMWFLQTSGFALTCSCKTCKACFPVLRLRFLPTDLRPLGGDIEKESRGELHVKLARLEKCRPP